MSYFILLYKFIKYVYIYFIYTYNYHKLFCRIVVAFCTSCILNILQVFLICMFHAFLLHVLLFRYPIVLFLTLVRLY
jgi:hypothetical protein